MNNIKERVLEWYEELPPARRQKVLLFGSLGTLVVVLWFAVQLGGDKKPQPVNPKSQTESIAMDEDLMADTLREDVLAENERLKGDLERLSERFENLEESFQREVGRVRADVDAVKNRPPAAAPPDTEKVSIAPANELAGMVVPGGNGSYPPPAQQGRKAQTNGDPENFEPITIQQLGAIGGKSPVLSNKAEKKTQKSIYLPIGFMEAELLTGLDALVGNDAQNNPEPVMVRVQAPAVLPNHVRANLSGCFVIGNGIGVLAKERIDVRAVSLSCVDFEERVVIDERIKGYFVDMDGKKGLSGRVVTRDGAVVGRAFAAGMMEGFGSVAELSSGTQSVSPLGSTKVFDAEEAAVAGVGRGVASTSQSLKDYYLDLAKTITPVIEVGPGKPVVLVLQEGVTLNIKEVEDVVQN